MINISLITFFYLMDKWDKKKIWFIWGIFGGKYWSDRDYN